MGSITSTLYLGLTYCCCTATSSLCNSCLGSTAPGTSGRKRSVLLLSVTISLALLFQYYVAPHILNHTGWWNVYRSLPGMGRALHDAWTDGCERFQKRNDDDDDVDVDEMAVWQCVGNSGVYRPTFVSTLFFIFGAVAAKIRPSINREVWPAKYVLCFFFLIGTLFIPNMPLLSGIYLIMARIGATIFIVLQQVILIDVAYNWNEDWVDKSNTADRIEYGSGIHWLRAIVATCVLFYASTIGGIVVLYKNFLGCPENNAVITLTLIGIVAVTGIQLSGTEGSLLTSSVMSLYVTYLAFSIVSKNPNEACNPRLGHNDVAGIVIGLTLTAVSLAWTGWSWSAEKRLQTDGIQATKSVSPAHTPHRPNPDEIDLDVPFIDPEEQPPSGIVTETDRTPDRGTELWKLNIVMALISCWVAVSLTGWGTIELVTGAGGDESGAHTAANPMVGRVNMAMIGVSQWTAMILYAWTLVAPRLFPDRDFS